MEDEASTSLDCKVLGNLRVVDLKQELEKRGLSKSGSKKDLVKRLKQVSLSNFSDISEPKSTQICAKDNKNFFKMFFTVEFCSMMFINSLLLNSFAK